MSKKAVVVDDDPKVVLLVKKLLTDLGFEIFTAEDGKTAWELVKANKPDLLISDMLLPGIHGAELCNLIREEADLAEMKIILMTAVYSEKSTKLDMNVRPDSFIAKPFSLKDLTNVISKLKNWD